MVACYIVENSNIGMTFYFRRASGTITSPNYPSRYPINQLWVYFIMAPVLSEITLFVKFFETEFHPTCDWDYLKVFAVSLIHRYCLNFICEHVARDLTASRVMKVE